MRPYGLYNRKNAQCHMCGSLERYRWLYLWFLRETDIFSKEITVLEVAPNPSFIRFFRNINNVRYISTNIHSNDVPVDFIADMADFPSKESSFDYIILMQILEHIEDDSSVFGECERLLKPKGKCIITIPFDVNSMETIIDSTLTGDKRLKCYGQNDHVKIYGTDVLDKMKTFNFTKVYQVTPDTILSKQEMRKYSIKASYQFHNYVTCDDLFICEK